MKRRLVGTAAIRTEKGRFVVSVDLIFPDSKNKYGWSYERRENYEIVMGDGDAICLVNKLRDEIANRERHLAYVRQQIGTKP